MVIFGIFSLFRGSLVPGLFFFENGGPLSFIIAMSANLSQLDPGSMAGADDPDAAVESAELSEQLRKEAAREVGPMTEEELLQRHITKGGVVSNYKTSAVIADELDREALQRAVKEAVLVLRTSKDRERVKEKADREVAKKSSLMQHNGAALQDR